MIADPRRVRPAPRERGSLVEPGSLVSIVVAVKNGRAGIARCLESVLGQTHRRRELIVIDGGSTDGTVDVLRAQATTLTYWESVADRGIYHAWNKGLRRATGEWIAFLGADDRYANADSLATLMARTAGDIDLVLGRMALIVADGNVHRVIGRPWRWEQMKRFPDIAHPGMLHRRSLFERHGFFDERYAIAGDYDFLMRLGRGTRAAFVDEVVISAGDAGVSRRDVSRVLDEVRSIQTGHAEIGRRRAAANYWTARVKAYARRWLTRTRRRASHRGA